MGDLEVQIVDKAVIAILLEAEVEEEVFRIVILAKIIVPLFAKTIALRQEKVVVTRDIEVVPKVVREDTVAIAVDIEMKVIVALLLQ